MVIRALGKRRLTKQVIELFDLLEEVNVARRLRGKGRSDDDAAALANEGDAAASVPTRVRADEEMGGLAGGSKWSAVRSGRWELEPNEESFEFLSNAMVASVEERSTARSMKELPAAVDSLPEVRAHP